LSTDHPLIRWSDAGAARGILLAALCGVRLLKTDKQKDNLAKMFWDMSKLVFAVFVFGPLANTGHITVFGMASGMTIGFTLAVSGYMLDGRELRR
jgi:hypothetical protein